MSRSSLVGTLLALLLLPAGTVAWLGYRLIQQDTALERQRIAESCETSANQAVQILSGLLADPSLFSKHPGSGALMAKFPGNSLLYDSGLPISPEASPEAFRVGEAIEYGRGEGAAAITIYERQAKNSDPRIRAGALHRLGRTQRKAGRIDEALQTYATLARMESVSVGGWSAPVAALWSRCELFASTGRSRELQAEALQLQQYLHSGRYPLTRAAYLMFADDAARWTGHPRPADVELLTDAVLQIKDEIRAGKRSDSGRAVLYMQAAPITVLWDQVRGALAVFAADRKFLEREWLSRVAPTLWLSDEHGSVFGTPRSGSKATRYSLESHLPWSVMAAAPPQAGDLAARRHLLIVLLAAVGIFTISGAYIVIRTLRKEFALGRMQEDFVAAVSHEFRTPLTTLRQLTEALEDGRIVNEERRTSCYRSLSRATQRLHRLVEDLLDFRRMQSAAMNYRRTRINTREFTARLASDFQREVEDRGFHISSAPGPTAYVLADGEALGRALWNLLDNAVKYSGTARSVELAAECREQVVEWSVRDHGIGIPERERALVFQKFFRGESPKGAGIRGTGIGLAMVEQIAAAHGGRVSVMSKEGAGSVFTIAIPREGAACQES